MKNYLVVCIEAADEYYNVVDLKELINDMYSQELIDHEFNVVKGWFFTNYKVFVSNSNIEELYI
jgi:hypothetical protein